MPVWRASERVILWVAGGASACSRMLPGQGREGRGDVPKIPVQVSDAATVTVHVQQSVLTLSAKKAGIHNPCAKRHDEFKAILKPLGFFISLPLLNDNRKPVAVFLCGSHGGRYSLSFRHMAHFRTRSVIDSTPIFFMALDR